MAFRTHIVDTRKQIPSTLRLPHCLTSPSLGNFGYTVNFYAAIRGKGVCDEYRL
jgi:hypothetical protein